MQFRSSIFTFHPLGSTLWHTFELTPSLPYSAQIIDTINTTQRLEQDSSQLSIEPFWLLRGSNSVWLPYNKTIIVDANLSPIYLITYLFTFQTGCHKYNLWAVLISRCVEEVTSFLLFYHLEIGHWWRWSSGPRTCLTLTIRVWVPLESTFSLLMLLENDEKQQNVVGFDPYLIPNETF